MTFTLFDPLVFIGPVDELSQTVKEVVCVGQTEKLKKTNKAHMKYIDIWVTATQEEAG